MQNASNATKVIKKLAMSSVPEHLNVTVIPTDCWIWMLLRDLTAIALQNLWSIHSQTWLKQPSVCDSAGYAGTLLSACIYRKCSRTLEGKC